MALVPGTRLGAYEVTASIGVGGMGEVYRARDTKLDRDVAIKVLPESFANDPDRLMRFEREAKTLASLNHPHIAQIYGFEHVVEAGLQTRLLAMELVDGEDLSQRISRGPIPVDGALPIAKQIAEALEAAHEAGIVHRDLKPANIKVRDDGTVKVLDFGLAKGQGAGTGDQGSGYLANSPTITSPAMTQAGIILGTAVYMAPEQAKGRSVDRRADIWAFGCVLYEMLTGSRAFDGEDTTEILGAIVKTEPDWSRLPSTTPAFVHALLRRCLQKDVKERLPHIGVARQEIETPRELAMPARRGRRQSASIAAGLVTGAAVTFALLQLSRPPAPRPPTMRLDMMPTADRPINIRAGRLTFALSPDNTFIVYGTGNTTEMVVRYFDRLEVSPLTGTINANPFAVSPDSKWILFSIDNQLKKIPVSGGAPILVSSLTGPILGASWGADNRILFAVGNSDGIQSVSADGGPASAITRVEFDKGDQSHSLPVALPGRNALVITVVSASGTRLEAHDLENNKTKVIVPGASQATYLNAGYLVYVLSDSLWASRFDLTRLELVGDPLPIRDHVGVSTAPSLFGRALYAASNSGTMAYVPVEAMPRTGERSLWWVDRKGAEEMIPAPERPYNYARLSNDGSRIAVSQGGDIWVWTPSAQNLARLTFDPGNESYPLWSPDDQRVIFASTRGGPANIWWQRADGTGAAERLTDSPYPHFPLGVSSDGQLVLREDRRETRNLAVLKLGGAATVQTLLELPNRENNADLSPDGRWLAYQSSEGGGAGDEIFVRPFPNVNGGVWQVSNGRGAKPRWSRDGRQLFFLSYATNTLTAVSVPPGSTFSPGPMKPVINDVNRYFNVVPGRPWDVSPDGERLLMIKEAAGPQPTTTKLIVVTNWVEELKRP